MRWKTVALAGALGPAAGCNIAYNTAHNLVNEPLVVCTQKGIEHRLRSEAHAVWRQVRVQYPRRAFTAEFRDGFTDGYVDYLDRGGNGSIPAAPPVKYTRHKKYFTENGQCLVKDYFLGFKYGQEIAIATGKRQFLTVPVLLPAQPQGPPAFTVQPATPVPQPELMPVPVPPLLPQPKSQGSDSPPSKFSPFVPEPGTAPPPSPPPGTQPTTGSPPAVLETPVPVPTVKLPAPPAEVPEFPAYIPTPSVLDDLPVAAPLHTEPPAAPVLHTEPPAVPAVHPEAVGK